MRLRRIVAGVALLVGAVGTLLLGFYDYLLMHTFAETFSAVVAIAVFLFAWNSRRMLGDEPFLVVVGIALLFVGVVDLLHMLAYPGMNVFRVSASTDAATNLAAQLWIVARGLFAVAFPVGLLLRPGAVRPWMTLAATSGITATLLALIFTGYFPACYRAGSGLTGFKIASEAVVAALLIATGVLLWSLRARFDPRVVRFVGWTLSLTIVSELCFVLYRSPFGAVNATGHVLKIAAYVMLYRAIVQIGLREPYALLFRELKQSETALAEANLMLEERVAARTADLERGQAELRRLARELAQVERRERRRLATMLHDDLAQLLATIKMRLPLLVRQEPAKASEEAGRVDALLDEALVVTRDLIAQLTPPSLDRGGLVDALRALAGRMGSHHGLRVEIVAASGLAELEPDCRETVFNAVRELLMNVARHSGAERALVELSRRDDGAFAVAVTDEGRGFDPDEVPNLPGEHGGFGLFNLRQQLALLGGELRVTSAPGAGSRVEVLVPQQSDTPEPLRR